MIAKSKNYFKSIYSINDPSALLFALQLVLNMYVISNVYRCVIDTCYNYKLTKNHSSRTILHYITRLICV